MLRWISEWWTTFRVWRESDIETWLYLTSKDEFDEDEFIELERPELGGFGPW